jgi:rod shape-determining protein MreD
VSLLQSLLTLRNGLLLLVCVAAAVLEASVPVMLPHPLRALRADLMLAVVIYLALNDEWIEGAALSFVAGYLSDLAAATPAGIYTFLAVLTFVVVRTTGSAFKAEGGLQAALLAAVVNLVHALLASLVFRLLLPGSSLGLRPGLLWSALATGFGAIPTFAVLRALDSRFLPSGEGIAGMRSRVRTR